MQITSVTAIAFGALSNVSLDLKPGLNVVVGCNESAKSTWHAAMYAAICGRARGRGQPRREDREFAERYRPWQGNGWGVKAQLKLDDGRLVEIRQDLDQAVDSRATDLGLGRDVSAEIMHEGAPDASRWLGMNRSVFSSVACVRQSEVLAVLDSANGLQRQLEAAATHANTSDPTASQAISRIVAFKAEHVGLDRANARKPLRRAKEAVAEAERELQTAKTKHAAYADLVAEEAKLQEAADLVVAQRAEADKTVTDLEELSTLANAADKEQGEADRLQEAVDHTRQALSTLDTRFSRAQELNDSLGGEEPAGNAMAEHVATKVATALQRWRSRPARVFLQGPDAASLKRQLDGLALPPSGDVSVDPDVQIAATALDAADAVARSAREEEPAATNPDAALRNAAQVGSASLRDWASALDSIETVDPVTLENAIKDEARARQALDTAQDAASRADNHYEAALKAGESRPAKQSTSRPIVLTATAAVVLGLVAVVLFLVGEVTLGAVASVLSVGAAVTAIVLGRRTSTQQISTASGPDVAQARDSRVAARDDVLHTQQRLVEATSIVKHLKGDAQDAEASRAAISAKCEANLLPVDAQALRILAVRVDQASQADEARKRWLERAERAEQRAAAAEASLREALQGRGLEVHDVREAHAAYIADCAARARQARESAQRPALEQALRAREREESQAKQAEEAEADCLDVLTKTAGLAGLEIGPATSADEFVSALESWQEHRTQETKDLDARREQWSDLQAQLDGCTLAELQDRRDAKQRELAELTSQASDSSRLADRAWAQVTTAAEPAGLPLADTRSGLMPAVTEALTAARGRLTALVQEVESALEKANEARGKRMKGAEQLPLVPEAEEKAATCQAKLESVQTLSATLDAALRHLQAAQESVHRTIAPTLQKTLVEWLPAVTAQRYAEATVDPETLQVKVRAGSEWVPARNLSYGTAEQVYLLLRVALVTHLADPDESCPLLLDDVTVQADEERTLAMLSTLATLASERQIVLFAQETFVKAWATRQAKAGGGVNLIELEQVPL